jgi:H+/Cl- antiporter ClcA
MKNIFNINVGNKITAPGTEAVVPAEQVVSNETEMSEIIKYLLLGIVAAGIVAMIYFYLLERKKSKELHKSEERFWKNLK